MPSAAAEPKAARAGLVARRDLVIRRQECRQRAWWVVKDPLTLRYFHFAAEERFVLAQLDGRLGLEEIQARFEARFAPQKLKLAELQQFLGTLYETGLVVSGGRGQGLSLLRRRRRRQWRYAGSAAANLLSLRFRGFDPDRLLTRLLPWTGWLFCPAAVAAAVLLVFAAATLVVCHRHELAAELRTYQDFFTPRNALWLAVTLALTKVLHEFGHGLTCKRFGGECHEMGLLLLVFVPCLYCNVTDSWLLPSKWRRAAIGAAGMYVEVVLASLAAFLWWFSEPGLLHQLCLSVMLVSSVTTVLFNGNPLLRYDGYYILADLAEAPNLRQRAAAVLQRKFNEWCLGFEPVDDPFLPDGTPAWFGLYTVAAGIYRWLVTLGILWFVHHALQPYRLEAIGDLFVALSVAMLVGLLLWKVGRFFYVPGRIDQVKRKRIGLCLGLFAAVVAWALFVPLPHRVLATFEVKPRGARPVFVDLPGTLVEVYVRPGDEVEPGTPLARLQDLALESELAALVAERDRRQAELDHLQSDGQHADIALRSQIPALIEAVAGLEEQVRQQQTKLERLILRSPAAGTVLPAPGVPRTPPEDGRLSSWYGSPWEERNLDCYLTQGMLVCQVGGPVAFEAHPIVEQGDVELLREGQAAVLKLDALPEVSFRGQVADIARQELRVSPTSLTNKAGGELATRTDAAGHERPLEVSYQVRVPLEESHPTFRTGTRGVARIQTDHQTLAQRAWRWLGKTFRFRW
jgi:putative peptide zinc metalloprotease protein